MITKKEKELLDLFGRFAPPSRSYHPNDMCRWGDFVFHVYKNSKRVKSIQPPTLNEMMSVLLKHHYKVPDVQHLYDMMTDDLSVVSRCWWSR